MYGNQKSATSGFVGVPGAAIHYDGPEVASDVPRVSREMGAIQKLLAEHNDLAAVIEQRLNAVLRPSGPGVESGSAGEPRPVSSPLTNDLEGFRDQLSHLLWRYNEILGRLEI